jgi:hypothetical protein
LPGLAAKQVFAPMVPIEMEDGVRDTRDPDGRQRFAIMHLVAGDVVGGRTSIHISMIPFAAHSARQARR